MDAQTKIAQLKNWFFQNMEGDSKPYFMLEKPLGNSRKKILNMEDGTANTQWEALERTIWTEYQNGVRRFIVSVRRGGKHGPAFESELDLGFSTVNGTSVASIGATQGAAPHANSIGVIEEHWREKLTEREQKLRQEFEFERRMDELKGVIAGLQEDRRTQLEKVSDGIGAIVERVNEMGGFDGISKIIMAMKAKPMVARPISGHPAAGQQVVEHPAQPGQSIPKTNEDADADTVALNEAIYKELLYAGTTDEELMNCDYTGGVKATQILTKGGFDNASDILEKIATFITENPIKALQMMKDVLPTEAEPKIEKNAKPEE